MLHLFALSDAIENGHLVEFILENSLNTAYGYVSFVSDAILALPLQTSQPTTVVGALGRKINRSTDSNTTASSTGHFMYGGVQIIVLYTLLFLVIQVFPIRVYKTILGGATDGSGQDGQDGAQGIQGEMGDPGIPGQDGNDGTDGADGAMGLPGQNGVDGANVLTEHKESKASRGFKGIKVCKEFLGKLAQMAQMVLRGYKANRVFKVLQVKMVRTVLVRVPERIMFNPIG